MELENKELYAIPPDISEEDLLVYNRALKTSKVTKFKNLLLSKLPTLQDGTKNPEDGSHQEELVDEKLDISDENIEEILEFRTSLLYGGQISAPSIKDKVNLLQTATNAIALVCFISGTLALTITAFMVIPVFVIPTNGAAMYMAILAAASILLLVVAILVDDLKWYTSNDRGKFRYRLTRNSKINKANEHDNLSYVQL